MYTFSSIIKLFSMFECVVLDIVFHQLFLAIEYVSSKLYIYCRIQFLRQHPHYLHNFFKYFIEFCTFYIIDLNQIQTPSSICAP